MGSAFREITAGENVIRLYDSRCRGPVVFLLIGSEGDSDKVWTAARDLAPRPFSLAVMSVEDWNHVLSPWPAEAVLRDGRSFGGGADGTLRTLEREIVPTVLDTLGFPKAPCFLAGYSLAGLCALYALYRTAVFSGAASVSGSLWFPGFASFVKTEPFPRTPERIYLSLGERESRTKHPLMRRVADATEEVYASFRARNVDCVLEWNPGGHFQDPELRLARGVAWLVD